MSQTKPKTFIVRVQLNTETIQNYTTLKNALLNAGFTKTITAKTGVNYILPNGNYLAESEKGVSEVLDIVHQIVTRIGDKTAMILVSEADSNAWVNLKVKRR